ncbi:MAG: Trk system potassium transporter TrkA [Clostridia bacterium]|nr:Trk system potassium transporter TrkA [Clostridia bacterium]
MKIVIVGDGKLGFTLAKLLSGEKHDITLIDNNSDVLEKSQEALDVMTVSGNGASLEIQEEADVKSAELLIAVTASDEVNLLCCALAKKLGCHHTIARVRNAEYTKQLQFMREDFGLSMIVNPELAASRTIFRIIQFPSFLKIDSFSKGRVELVELKVDDDSPLIGKRLDKLFHELKLKILVCAVERGEEIFIPNGDFELKAGDKINVTAPRSNLARMIKQLGISKQKIRNVMTIGGGKIAEYLAEELISSGVNVKIVENNHERCVELASRLPEALIINDDGSSRDVLLAEGIEETDAVITLTNLDEQNLVISMYANHVGVPKTITKLNRTEYNILFSDIGIGSTICPKDIVANDVIRYVRSMEHGSGGSILTLHKIVDDKAEAIEFYADEGTRYLSVPLKDIPLKKNLLIASINHNGNIIIPSGADYISRGDTVILVTTGREPIKELNDIFADE